MQNPWLGVPLEDYEGHMNSPEVSQLTALADLFEQALRDCRPESVAILGIAGGNGLDRVDGGAIRRVVGIDIQPAYLDEVGRRHRHLPLKLVCADLSQDAVEEIPVDLVHAALIFEHAGMEACLRNAVKLVTARGFLSVVLQLPSTSGAAEVAPTAFTSIRTLSRDFRLIDRVELSTALRSEGFELRHETSLGLPAGKAFWLGIFQRM